MAATNPEMSPMTPPPRPTTNELRSSPASINSSQIFSICVSDFDFSPAGIRTKCGEKFSAVRLSEMRSPNNRAEVSSAIMAQRRRAQNNENRSQKFQLRPSSLDKQLRYFI